MRGVIEARCGHRNEIRTKPLEKSGPGFNFFREALFQNWKIKSMPTI